MIDNIDLLDNLFKNIADNNFIIRVYKYIPQLDLILTNALNV